MPTRHTESFFDQLQIREEACASDRRRLRAALGVAVAFHLLLPFLPLPEPATAASAEPPEQRVYVVHNTRFKPPEKPPEPPQPRTRQVPIPDPTPDEPEILREPVPPAPVLELPVPDLLFDLPEAPPPLPPPVSDGPLTVGGEVVAPVKISAPPPRYTEMARRARVQGKVVLRAVIDRDGSVTSVEVVKPLPLGLTEAAADAVRRWRFEPATLRGKPVPVFLVLQVDFQLQ